MKIYTDGSSSKVGKSAFCVLVDGKKKKDLEIFDEPMNSFDIELLGVKHALNKASKNSIIFTDSMAVIVYLRRIENSKNEDEMRLNNMINNKRITLQFIPREQNKAGIYLENRIKKLRRYSNGSTNFRKKY